MINRSIMNNRRFYRSWIPKSLPVVPWSVKIKKSAVSAESRSIINLSKLCVWFSECNCPLIVKKPLFCALWYRASVLLCVSNNWFPLGQTCRPQTHFLLCKYHLSYVITRIDHLPGPSARHSSWTNVHTQTSNSQNARRCALSFCH